MIKLSNAQDNLTVSLSEIETLSADTHRAIELLEELAPVAKVGTLGSPIIPAGLYVEIAKVIDAISEDQDLCRSISSDKIYFDRGLAGTDVYTINSFEVKSDGKAGCSVNVDKIELSKEIAALITQRPSEQLAADVQRSLDSIGSSIVRVVIYVNNKGEMVSAEFWRELKGMEAFFAKPLFQTRRGPNDNPTSLTYVYNFTLKRGKKID